VQCFSEFTPGNRYSLKARLQQVFGSDKTIQTYDDYVGLKFGHPTTNVY